MTTGNASEPSRRRRLSAAERAERAEWHTLRDDVGEAIREAEREWYQAALDEAEKLRDEGWTDSDIHTGIMVRRGESATRRVPVLVYMMYKALLLGIGIQIEREMDQAGSGTSR